MARRTKDITEQEKLFAEAFVTNGFKRREAVKEAGFKTDNIQAKGAALLSRPVVAEYITKLVEGKRKNFYINELDIIEGLYEEAKLTKAEGGTQQGRIQAWTAIGKHYGMFDSKVKELQSTVDKGANGGTQINILNYNAPKAEIQAGVDALNPNTIEAESEKLIDKQLKKEVRVALEGIKIESYAPTEEQE